VASGWAVTQTPRWVVMLWALRSPLLASGAGASLGLAIASVIDNA